MGDLEIEVFKIGEHTASDGRKIGFTTKEVDEAISTYNPTYFRAPLIVSHDTGDYSDTDIVNSELAFGVVHAFKRVGDTVKAIFKKYAPEFKTWVDQGRLHSISSSFYLPESPHNPYPGKWAFRHIAALGKSPPAVKGLLPIELREAISFEANEEGTANFCMPYRYGFGAVASALHGLRDNLISEQGLEAAEQFLPYELIANLEAESRSMYVTQEAFWEMQDRLRRLEGTAPGAAVPNYAPPIYKQQETPPELEKPPELEQPETPVTPEPKFEEEEPINMGSHRKSFAEILKKAGYGEDLKRLARTADLEESIITSAATTGYIKPEDRTKLASALDLSEVEFNSAFKSDAEFDAAQEAARLRSELITLRLENRRQASASFVQKLEHEKRITPALKNPIPIEFSEGNETKKREVSLVDHLVSLNEEQRAFMSAFLSRLPQQGEPESALFAEDPRFNESTHPAGSGEPLDYAAIGEAARLLVIESRAKGIELSESQAVDRVMAKYGVRN